MLPLGTESDTFILKIIILDMVVQQLIKKSIPVVKNAAVHHIFQIPPFAPPVAYHRVAIYRIVVVYEIFLLWHIINKQLLHWQLAVVL